MASGSFFDAWLGSMKSDFVMELAAVAVEDGAARRLALVFLSDERLHARRELVALHELHIAIAHDDDADEHEHSREYAHDAPLDLVLSLPFFLQNGTPSLSLTQTQKSLRLKVHRLIIA